MNRFALILLVFGFNAFALGPGSYEVKVKTSVMDFKIEGKADGSVKAQGENFTAENVVISVGGMKTGLEARDKHTQEKFKNGKGGRIRIVKAQGKDGKGNGIIEIQSEASPSPIQKPFAFTYEKKGSMVVALFNLNLKDFGFSGINYQGVGVEDEVEVTAALPVK